MEEAGKEKESLQQENTDAKKEIADSEEDQVKLFHEEKLCVLEDGTGIDFKEMKETIEKEDSKHGTSNKDKEKKDQFHLTI